MNDMLSFGTQRLVKNTRDEETAQVLRILQRSSPILEKKKRWVSHKQDRSIATRHGFTYLNNEMSRVINVG